MDRASHTTAVLLTLSHFEPHNPCSGLTGFGRSEQDQPATTKSEQANPLHNEVFQQWQLNSLLKKADTDKSGSLSEREIKDAANNEKTVMLNKYDLVK